MNDTGPRTRHQLSAEAVSFGYGAEDIVKQQDVSIPKGEITAIVGANGCGKSTLLRGLVRLLKPTNGNVLLDDAPMQSLRSIDIAKAIGLLPQSPMAPDAITVADLVGRGRYPHQGWFRQWTSQDDQAVEAALRATDTAQLADRTIAELSGGQRQRAWIAMALAQETSVLLLDEPTTFLDINHQVELLDLLTDLNRESQRTIVMVLHDLNLACRYATHLIAMKNGVIAAKGPPNEIVTAELITHVFNVNCAVVSDPASGTPMIVPLGRHHC